VHAHDVRRWRSNVKGSELANDAADAIDISSMTPFTSHGSPRRSMTKPAIMPDAAGRPFAFRAANPFAWQRAKPGRSAVSAGRSASSMAAGSIFPSATFGGAKLASPSFS
jgi:hypothetical protein